MDHELIEGLAGEVAAQLGRLRVEIRRELADEVAAVQRAAATENAALRERVADLAHRLDLATQEVQTLRAVAGDPVAAFTRDADGAISLIQRNGPARALPLPDVAALVHAAVETLGAALREVLQAETHADVARTFEHYCNAPAWSETAVYTEGQIVQTDVGRTYRVRAGVRACLGRAPGDDAEHWERLGTGGFRVFKSKPSALQPGDVFTERDARFMHDGASTILFVPAAAKVSDIERAVKGPHGMAQDAQAQLRDHAVRLEVVAREGNARAAAIRDIDERAILALAQVEALRAELEALQRRVAQAEAA